MSKSKNERRKAASPSKDAQQIHTVNTTIAGKLIVSDWCRIIHEDDSNDFISDLITDIVHNASDISTRKFIDSHARPYAISSCRKLLLDFIGWQCLQSDNGESHFADQLPFLDDEEPTVVKTDSWAQGSVPVLNKDNMPHILEMSQVSINKESNEGHSMVSNSLSSSNLPSNETTVSPLVTYGVKTSSDKENATGNAPVSVDVFDGRNLGLKIKLPGPTQLRKVKIKPYVGRLPSSHLPPVPPLSERHSNIEGRLLST